MKLEYEHIIKRLENKDLFSTSKNNDFVLEFAKAKLNGGYGRLTYKNSIVKKTIVKKIRNLTLIDRFFNKDFDKLNEDDIIKLKNDLNNDIIKKNKTLINRKDNIVSFEIEKTNKPLSYRTKKDYVTNFKEFFQFVIEYVYQTSNKKIELKDNTRFLNIKQPEDYSDVKINFITDEELNILFNNIKNIHFKALIQISVMSGARPIEALNIRYGKEYNLYKNNQNRWVIHLPKMKRLSYKKYPIVIDMFEDELYPYLDNIIRNKKESELIFKMTFNTFSKLMKHYTIKYLNKHYSPKILRKTARMIRSNAGYTHDWINKLMGHSPNSRIQAHYTNYDGIETDDLANEKLKDRLNPTLKEEYNKLKLKMQAQEEQMNEMKKQQETIMKAILKDIKDKIQK
jgi:hypothetical protein